MNLPKTEKEMIATLLKEVDHSLSCNGCNDFIVANTPETYASIEEMGASNLRCSSIEEFRKHPNYEDYKPNISKDGKRIYTQDYMVLALLKKRLGL